MPAWSTWGLQAEDSLPWGQRTRCSSQSTSKRSIVYPPSTLPCQDGFGRGGPTQIDAQFLAAADQQLGVDVGRVHQVLPRR